MACDQMYSLFFMKAVSAENLKKVIKIGLSPSLFVTFSLQSIQNLTTGHKIEPYLVKQ